MSETTQQEAPQGTGDVLVHLSPLAAEKVHEYMSEEGMTDGLLRVSVLPGGCSGFEYGLELDDVAREDDFVFVSRGVRVVVDPFSAQYLAGVSIDFTSSFQGTGFKFANPNATGSCGCGTSFAV
jgi:iron-sulfur cluster assembly protein